MKILKQDLLILSLAVAIGYGEANAAEQPNPADDATVVESLRDLNNSMSGSWTEGLTNFARTLMSWKNKSASAANNIQPHITMGPDLKALRDDFNAKVGTVRLLFIVGPTCGGCLFGMEQIDEALLRDNEDPRLNTFVVHVPTLGAKEKDVAPATQFLTGQNVIHYWEDTGIIGSHYQKVLNMGGYCWDTWMVFGPEAHWDKDTPPTPVFWVRHMSDPGLFAAKVRGRLATL